MKPTALKIGSLATILPAVTVVTAVVTGVLVGVEISLLVIASGALAGVIALIWASVQALTGESPLTLEEALTLGAPSAEEEQKRSVLRALKDLDFERGVGKISEEDYAELSTKYRAEAKRLMQLLDAGAEPERVRAEQALKERLEKSAKAKASAPTPPADEPTEPSEPAESSAPSASDAPASAAAAEAAESASEAPASEPAPVAAKEGS